MRIALALFGAFGSFGTAGVFALTGRGFGFDFALTAEGAGVTLVVTGIIDDVYGVAGIGGVMGISGAAGIGDVAGIGGDDELEGVCLKVPETKCEGARTCYNNP
ncbi:hypothetical protein BDR03DRAFT_987303 [Suillus americanus]|nr:hypothetical protein BDR03DRAFT_987303 [Suillus americanus]